MNKKVIVCEKCKKNYDVVRLAPLVGDEKLLQAGTKVGQWKCARCDRTLIANEKMFVVTPPKKTFRCPHCNRECHCNNLTEINPNNRFNLKEKIKSVQKHWEKYGRTTPYEKKIKSKKDQDRI